jgi:hypothetical protein
LPHVWGFIGAFLWIAELGGGMALWASGLGLFGGAAFAELYAAWQLHRFRAKVEDPAMWAALFATEVVYFLLFILPMLAAR